jgi:large subunit ribosomal protein L31
MLCGLPTPLAITWGVGYMRPPSSSRHPMKSGIHPDYKDATITCACGAVVDTRSTRGSFTTDVCSACHPFYTGKHKIMDVAGRVDRFRKKYANTGKV